MASDKKRRKKYRVRKGRVAAAAGIFAAVVAAVVTACVFFANKGNNSHKGNSSPTKEFTVDGSGIVQNGEYIKIDLDDCNLYVGNILRLRCISNPAEYSGSVIWSSSNQDIVSVNGKGDIIVKAEGVAAISATCGVLSDSVIINAIGRNNDNYEPDFPVYDVSEGEIVVIQTVPSNGQTETDGQPVTQPSNEQPEAKPPVKPTEGQPVTQPQNPSGGENNPPATQPYETPGSQSPAGTGENTGNGQPQTTPWQNVTEGTLKDPGNPETDPEQTENEIAAGFAAELRNAGFTRYLDDTYIYVEAGNYLGEIIVGEAFAQIYIMTRTTSFDAAIKRVIMSLLPTEYENAFAQLISAQTDRTFGADGHKVRIVAPVGGGHAQLIIYY